MEIRKVPHAHPCLFPILTFKVEISDRVYPAHIPYSLMQVPTLTRPEQRGGAAQTSRLLA